MGDSLQAIMSLPSGVTMLKPIKGSELMKQGPAAEVIPAGSRYVPPSRRGDEVKEQKALTAEQLDSQATFPSLPTAGHMTKAASWGKLRARLSSPPVTPRDEGNSQELQGNTLSQEHSMKLAIEQSLRRNQAAKEDAQHREAITDPFLMTKEKSQREGWEILPLNLKGEEKRQWIERSSYAMRENVEQPYAWPAAIMGFSVDKVQKLIHPS
jgi:hypothetical protein